MRGLKHVDYSQVPTGEVRRTGEAAVSMAGLCLLRPNVFLQARAGP